MSKTTHTPATDTLTHPHRKFPADHYERIRTAIDALQTLADVATGTIGGGNARIYITADCFHALAHCFISQLEATFEAELCAGRGA
jgi:hypothetical protein